MTQKIKSSKYGFTLIELLLGLGLFAIIGLIVYSTFATGVRLSRTFDVENEVYREARLSFDLISKELENMAPYNFSGSYPEKSSFQGTSDHLKFLIFDNGSFKFIQYLLERPTDSRIYQTIIGSTYARNVSTTLTDQLNQKINYLIREEVDFFDGIKETPDKKAEFEIISTHVVEESLKFSYGYFESDQATELSWKNEWDLKYLPRVVRIELDYLMTDSEKSDKTQQTLHFSRDILLPNAKGMEETAG
jgi:prepilin-type N-terminal cleavage/methylation domain-containing protein